MDAMRSYPMSEGLELGLPHVGILRRRMSQLLSSRKP